MYAKLFHFPEFHYHLTYDVVLTASLVCIAASALGAYGAIHRAVSLPPAEAMRPEPPTSFGPTLLERMNLGHFLPPVMRMIVRQLERHPVKTGLSVFAISLAVAIVVLGNFMEDAVNYVLNAQFNEVQRYDMSITTIEPMSNTAIHEVASMPGVLYCEPVRGASTRMRHGPRSRRVSIQGLPANSQLYGLVDINGNNVSRLPPDGLIISRKLAEILDLKVGDSVQVEVLQGKRPVKEVPIVGALQDFSGVSAYMNIDALAKLLREGPTITGANMLVDAKHTDAVVSRIETRAGDRGDHDQGTRHRELQENGGREPDDDEDDQSVFRLRDRHRRGLQQCANFAFGTKPRASHVAGYRLHTGRDFRHSVGRAGDHHAAGRAARDCGSVTKSRADWWRCWIWNCSAFRW